MKPYGIVLVGCGVVGGGTAVILTKDLEEINRKTGLNLVLKKIVDLNWTHALKLGIPEALLGKDLDEALKDPEAQVVIELVGGLTFAKTIFEKALKAGKHVVSANKALLATHGPELLALAHSQGLSIGFEASCAGGIPVIRVITENLLANRIDALYGILNGTCNYILSEMVKNGAAYATALKQAQELGYAEADPTLDVSGMDSAHKITILSSLAFGRRVALDQVHVQGIQDLAPQDTAQAQTWGYLPKLIASAQRQGDRALVQVRPTLVPRDLPLGNIWGSFNGLSLYASSLGHSFYYGRGAGASPTASAVVSDVIGLASGLIPLTHKHYRIWQDQTSPLDLIPPREESKPAYLRLTVPGASSGSLAAELRNRGLTVQQSADLPGETAFLLAPAKEGDVLDIARSLGSTQPPVYLPVLPERAEFPR